MKFKLRKLNIDVGRPVVFMHKEAAKKLNLHVGDRVEVSHGGKKLISVIDVIGSIINQGEIAFSHEIAEYEKLRAGEIIDVNPIASPVSSVYISKKMHGEILSKEEITSIIQDIVNNTLTEAEIAYFVLGVYERGMTIKENIYLTEAIYKTGEILSWPRDKKIVDKHSVGGIPGNRTTPIVVAICASLGVIMPKTSSRAITSASGTADTMETIANVDFSANELKKIVNKIGACLAWGGSLGLAPADDKLIRVERLLNLDPESQLIASILAKKLAVGSKFILIDIPYGEGAKVTESKAKKLKKRFISIGKYFKLHIRVVLTDGSQPIGNGIGPILEIHDVLKVLKREKSPKDLENKSIFLAGQILEMIDLAPKGSGSILAKETLYSGKALEKFDEIISAQGKKSLNLKPAKYKKYFKAKKSGSIKKIENKSINHICRLLGCPADKSSGIYLHRHKNEKVKKGEVILTLYSESGKKMQEAFSFLNKSKVFIIS